MSLNIEIRTVPHKAQRYDTCGDWFYEGDKLIILVSELGDWRKEYLVADHELREAMICRHKGITAEMVDAFDFTWKGEGEPGDDPKCPCRKEHFFATSIERLTAAELEVNWTEYDKQIENLEWNPDEK